MSNQIDAKKKLNDENAKKLQHMLQRLEIKQAERAKDRHQASFGTSKSRASPVRYIL